MACDAAGVAFLWCMGTIDYQLLLSTTIPLGLEPFFTMRYTET